MSKGMEKVEVYRFQLEAMAEALRVVANAYKCRSRETCLDRMVSQAEIYAQNALDGRIDERVEYQPTNTKNP